MTKNSPIHLCRTRDCVGLTPFPSSSMTDCSVALFEARSPTMYHAPRYVALDERRNVPKIRFSPCMGSPSSPAQFSIYSSSIERTTMQRGNRKWQIKSRLYRHSRGYRPILAHSFARSRSRYRCRSCFALLARLPNASRTLITTLAVQPFTP